MDRRAWLGLLVRAGGAVTALVVGIPALIAALTPGFRRRREPWQAVGKVEQFPIGEVREAEVRIPREDWSRALRSRKVYVWRQSAADVVVYSRNCTDLSCPVNYDRGSQCFFCPCHGGIFAKTGEPMAGPPKEPLFRYANRVRDAVLEIDLDSVPPMA